ncbi:MAG TPA: tyrosine-type recombinase/integrase [Ktedonobacteraceae bacterium]|nr:tyrosine-type recombinase/integrase [Ktedonobacteraceae bacterium]
MELIEVVEQFLVDCKVRGLTDQAIDFYRKRLTLFVRKLSEKWGVTQLEQVKIIHLRQFVQLLMETKADENNPHKPAQEKPLSAYTIRGYVRSIKRLFSWCIDEDLLNTNPATRLVQPKAPEYIVPTFTPEHIEKMLAVCDQTTVEGFRNYVLLLVFLDTGMRLSELCGLKLTDIDSQFRYVKVFGKGRKEREIGLHPEVGKLVWKYIHKYRSPADPDETALFVGRRGEPFKPNGVATLLKKIKKECGLEGVRVSAHTFRHTFAKFYLQRGGEVFKLSREMGHGTVQVTELYLKDFHSTEARQEHSTYSPIGTLDLKGRKKSRKKDKNK